MLSISPTYTFSSARTGMTGCWSKEKDKRRKRNHFNGRSSVDEAKRATNERRDGDIREILAIELSCRRVVDYF
jgi:hypothetical protein